MCDVCEYCRRAGWEVPLRLTPENMLSCCDCWDAPDWEQLQTPDDARDMHGAAMDDMAHARRSAAWEARP